MLQFNGIGRCLGDPLEVCDLLHIRIPQETGKQSQYPAVPQINYIRRDEGNASHSESSQEVTGSARTENPALEA